MPTQEVDYPQFWRFRAEQVRSFADKMKTVGAKAIMTRIAVDYERIADLVEQGLRGSIADVIEQQLRERKQQL
jgi:hypothetical protein